MRLQARRGIPDPNDELLPLPHAGFVSAGFSFRMADRFRRRSLRGDGERRFGSNLLLGHDKSPHSTDWLGRSS
jgi:hypothetical protein